MTPHLFHIVDAQQWAARAPSAPIVPADGEDFIHLCDAARIEEVVNRFFQNRPIVVVQIDASQLAQAKLRWEDLYGHGAFPHYFGAIEATLIVGVDPRST